MNNITMYSLVVLVLFIKLNAEAMFTDNPYIYLDNYNDRIVKGYTVLKDKPLKIVILSVLFMKYAWCNDSYSNQTFVLETELSVGNSTIHITNVTAQMSTKWACTILHELHPSYTNTGKYSYSYKNITYGARDVYFNLHVRGAVPVELDVNDWSLTTFMTDLSVHYDGDAYYGYEDGEDIVLSCTKVPHDVGVLRLEYYNAKGILLFETQHLISEQHLFRAVLKSENNNYYLDCICVTDEPKREYRYRTTFYVNKQDLDANAKQHVLSFFVNGFQMLPLNEELASGNKDYYDDYMVYKYIDGEVLNITCKKNDENMNGNLTFHINDEKIMSGVSGNVLRTLSLGEIMISLETYRLEVDRKTVFCRINNTDVMKTARLQLLSGFANDVRIIGLPRQNVLYQYKYSTTQWITEYQYSVNETLNLTCVAKRFNLHLTLLFKLQLPMYKWEFQGAPWRLPGQTEQFETFMSPDLLMSNIHFTKTLNETHNQSRIQCVIDNTYNHIAEVILHLKPEIQNYDMSDNKTNSNDNNNTHTIAYSVSAAGLVMLLVLVPLWYKKKICCTKQQQGLQAPTIDPASVFYVNLLDIFRPQNEREAAELENDYEEIDNYNEEEHHYEVIDNDNEDDRHYEQVL